MREDVRVSEVDYYEGDKIVLVDGEFDVFVTASQDVTYVPEGALEHIKNGGTLEIDGVDVDGDVYVLYPGGAGYMSPDLLKYFVFSEE